MGTGAYAYEADHDWGRLPAGARRGATRTASCRTRRGTSTCTTPSTRRARARHHRRLRPEGQLRPLVGQGVPRRRARPAHPQGRQGRVSLPDRQRRQPEDDAAAGAQAAVVKTTLKGEVVWSIDGPPDVDGYKPAADGTPAKLQPDQRRHRAERRRLRRRRLRLVLHQPVQRQGRAHPDVRRPRLRAGQADRAARHLDRHARRRAAARRRRSPQQPAAALHARRRARRLRPRLPAAVPLRRAQGPGRRPRPARPGDAARQAATRSSRTSATRSDPEWNNPLRRGPREEFIPGQFICPHGACFDHDGNIFVAEWVEVGRVTKLRKV